MSKNILASGQETCDMVNSIHSAILDKHLAEPEYHFDKITATKGSQEVVVTLGILPGVVRFQDSAGNEFTTQASDIHLVSETIKTIERYNGYLTPQTDNPVYVKTGTGA